MRDCLGKWRTRASVTAISAGLALALISATAGALQPWPSKPPEVSNPYSFWEYLFSPSNPLDYSDNLSQSGAKSGDSTLDNSPQELSGIIGADVTGAWRISTGRPDVTIAILDDGIRWRLNNNAIRNLIAKVRLNPGELPEPQPLTPAADPAHPYDKNHDGVFNIHDYCSVITSPFICEDDRVTDRNGSGLIDPEDLILTPGWSDGVDSDGNGYVDDIAGWDFFEDDNNPFDSVAFGHGMGRGIEAAAEAENGVPGVGNCPSCMFVPVRVGDSYVVEGPAWAKAVIYSVDTGANVIGNSLGLFGTADLAQQAVDYAISKGVTVVAASANEEAAHHNMPAGLERVIVMNAVRDGGASNPPGYLYLDSCSNRGGKIFASFPTTNCSSGSTGNTAGAIGLVVSTAMNRVSQGRTSNYMGDDASEASFALSPNEVWQVLRSTADDIDFSTPRGGDPPNNYALPPVLGVIPNERWPTVEGWDQYNGYGRINVAAAVKLVSDTTTALPLIPPEAEITSPLWFDVLPGSGHVPIEGRVAANRADSFNWQLEWAPGVEPPRWPETDTWTPIAGGSATSAVTGVLGSLDMATVAPLVNGASGPPTGPDYSPDPERFALRLRLRAVDNHGNKGEFQKQVSVHDDPDLVPGWPKKIGVGVDSSPGFADIDGDGNDELVIADSGGLVHAFKPDGSEAAGWPVALDPVLVNSGSAAFTVGGLSPVVRDVASRGAPATVDLDGDGLLEVVVAGWDGKVYVFQAYGSRRAGFPVSTEPNYSLPASTNTNNRLHRAIAAQPAVGDMDGDGTKEIVATSHDRHVYAWHANGSKVAGWPVLLRDPAKVSSVNPTTHRINSFVAGANALRGTKIITTPTLADITGDARPEVIVGSNETYGETPNFPASYDVSAMLGSSPGNSRSFAINPDGMSSTGVPAGSALHTRAFVTGWPVRVPLFVPGIAPGIATGINSQAVAVDVDGDGRPEIATQGIAGIAMLFDADGVGFYGRDGDGRDLPVFGGENGPASASGDSGSSAGGGGIAAADLNGDGVPDLLGAGSGPIKFLNMRTIGNIPQGNSTLNGIDLTQPGADGTSGGVNLPGFPHPANDAQVLATPIAADLDGDGVQEGIIGSGENDLRAVDAFGKVPDGWPKFTSSWNMATPAVGDWGDGQVIAEVTRRGYLYVWKTRGSICTSQWPRYGHDPANTGNLGTDAIPPGSITEVVAVPTSSGTTLSWSSPGDDRRCGTVAGYEIRTADSPIDDGNWGTATPYTGPQSPPVEGGSAYATDLPRSLEGKWAAVRAVDDAGNTSRVSPSVQLSALPLGTISGTFAGGMWGAISVYSRNTGTVAAYYCCLSSDSWSIEVPVSECSSGEGYSLSFLPHSSELQSRWYESKGNFSEADCVSAPSFGNDMGISSSGIVSGYVKDRDSAADIDGAVVYAFRSDTGKFAGWAVSGASGEQGRYALNLPPDADYKLLVKPGSGYVQQWFSGSANFSEATAVATPSTANFSVAGATFISGYVKDAASANDIDGALIYVYNASSGAFSGWTKSGMAAVGRYSFAGDPGSSYKILAVGPPGNEDLWGDGAAGYVEATPVVAGSALDFSLRQAGVISGVMTQLGEPVTGGTIAAYTTCGCTTPKMATTNGDGSYAVKVATTAASGWEYRLRFNSPSGQTQWYQNSVGFGGAADVASPSSGIDQEIPP